MKLSTEQINLLSELAISAAKKAGEYIQKAVHSKITVKRKEEANSLASEVFTEIDEGAQEIILSVLNQSIKDYDLGLLAEEKEDDFSRLTKDYFWCIDPLDGTLAFIEQQPGYSVAISLLDKKGTPIIGVVYDPVTSTLYHAIKGLGAFKNETPWVLNLTNNRELNVFTDKSFFNHVHFDTISKELHSLGFEKITFNKYGGAVMNACWVLEHPSACYFKLPKKQQGGGSIWDYGATTCLFNELNIPSSDIYGSPLLLNEKKNIFMNKTGVLFTTDEILQKKIINFCKQFIK